VKCIHSREACLHRLSEERSKYPLQGRLISRSTAFDLSSSRGDFAVKILPAQERLAGGHDPLSQFPKAPAQRRARAILRRRFHAMFRRRLSRRVEFGRPLPGLHRMAHGIGGFLACSRASGRSEIQALSFFEKTQLKPTAHVPGQLSHRKGLTAGACPNSRKVPSCILIGFADRIARLSPHTPLKEDAKIARATPMERKTLAGQSL